MEYERLNELIGEIQESPEKILNGDDPDVNREKYEKSLQQKFFDFQEEFFYQPVFYPSRRLQVQNNPFEL